LGWLGIEIINPKWNTRSGFTQKDVKKTASLRTKTLSLHFKGKVSHFHKKITGQVFLRKREKELSFRKSIHLQ
jgi:hypothetical protein